MIDGKKLNSFLEESSKMPKGKYFEIISYSVEANLKNANQMNS